MEVTKKLSDFFSKEKVDEVLKLVTNGNQITIADACYGMIANLKTVEDVVENFDVENCKDDQKCQEFCFNYMKAASDYNVSIIGVITEIKNLFKLHKNDFDVVYFFNALIANEKKEDGEVINVPIVTTSEEVDPEAETKQQKPKSTLVQDINIPSESQTQAVMSVHRNISPSSIAAPMIKPVNLAKQSGCGCGNPNCSGAHNTNAKRVRNEAPAPKTHQPKNDELKQLQTKVNDLKKIVTFTLSAGRQINTTTVNTLLGVLNGQTLRNELMARGLISNNELHGLVEIMPPMQYYDPVQYPYSFMLQGVNGQMALIQMGGSPILNNGQYYDIYRVI